MYLQGKKFPACTLQSTPFRCEGRPCKRRFSYILVEEEYWNRIGSIFYDLNFNSHVIKTSKHEARWYPVPWDRRVMWKSPPKVHQVSDEGDHPPHAKGDHPPRAKGDHSLDSKPILTPIVRICQTNGRKDRHDFRAGFVSCPGCQVHVSNKRAFLSHAAIKLQRFGVKLSIQNCLKRRQSPPPKQRVTWPIHCRLQIWEQRVRI